MSSFVQHLQTLVPHAHNASQHSATQAFHVRSQERGKDMKSQGQKVEKSFF